MSTIGLDKPKALYVDTYIYGVYMKPQNFNSE